MKNHPLELGLSAKTKKILASLQKAKLTISELSRVTGISRATLYTHIDTLLKRDMVTTSKKGKRTLYSALSKVQIEHKIISSIIHDTETISIPNEISYFSGLKQIQNLWLKIGAQPKHSRVVAFQSNSSLRYSLTKMNVDIAKRNHKNILKNKIILEQYMEEGMHEFVKDIMIKENISHVFPSSDFTQRTTSTTVIKQGVFNEPVEFFILFDSILIIDWKLEKGYEIKNIHIVSMYKKMFTLIKEVGKAIDNAQVTKKVFG